MRIINEVYNNFTAMPQLSEYADANSALFFDIETTGLKKETTSLYLVGCGYYVNNVLNTRFFFADDENEELSILTAFFDFAKGFTSVIHFNGTKFDMPYLAYKAKLYNVPNPLNQLESIDIYKLIKPLRYLLFRESMRQKCVEDFCGITRLDKYNGGELIEVYKEYEVTKDEKLFELLMLHNREDVLGMHQILPILNYLKLKDCSLLYTGSELNTYEDLEGNEKQEIIINYSLDIDLIKPFSLNNNSIYFKFSNNPGTLCVRLNVYSGILNHYYENYTDYVYLTTEKRCIHKSLADSIDKSLKMKAKKEHCYSEVSGQFIPSFGYVSSKGCGDCFKNRNNYVPLPKSDDATFFNEYGKYILVDLINSKPKRH